MKTILAAVILSTLSATANASVLPAPVIVYWDLPPLPYATPAGVDLILPDVTTTAVVDGSFSFKPNLGGAELLITNFHFDAGLSHQSFSWQLPSNVASALALGGALNLRSAIPVQDWGLVSPAIQISFRANPTPVPEISTLWLVGLGFVFAGLGGVARKKGV